MRIGILAGVLLASGCAEPVVPVGENPNLDWVEVVNIPSRINPDLDVLFVVDDSAGMEQKQKELARSFERLVAQLEFFEYEGRQGLPNLHVGVVSTDMGVGPAYAVEGCDAAGDQGVLQGSSDGQMVAQGRFLRDVAVGEERDANYDGTLGEAFADMSRLGGRGCGVEQPLQAMRVALDGSRTENAGFLRDGAALAVIVVSDEDDCSVADERFFDPALDNATADFRCFSYGAVCNDDVMTEGSYSDCSSDPNPRYMRTIDEYGAFLNELRGDQLVVASMAGGSTDAEIAADTGGALSVVSQCEQGSERYPAVRLQSFVDQVPGHGFVAPQCGEGAFYALAAAGKQIRKMLGTSCMDGAVVDLDPDAFGVQPMCEVWQRHADGSADPIPACSAPPHQRWQNQEAPCYYIDEGGCGDYFGTQLKLFVWWGRDRDGSWRSQPHGVDVTAECLVDTSRASP